MRRGVDLRRRGGRVIRGAENGLLQPSDIADLSLWFRPDLGLYEDSSLTVPALDDDDVVGGWDDQAGTNNATQATTADKMIFKTGIINGQSVVRGVSNDFLSIGTWLTTQTHLFVVVKTTNTAVRQVFIRHYASSTDKFHLGMNSTGTYEARRDLGGAFHSGNQASPADTNFHLLEVRVDDNLLTCDLWVDGVAGSGTGAFATLNAAPSQIGANFNTNFLVGDVADIFAYSAIKTGANLETIKDYVRTRYGLTIS